MSQFGKRTLPKFMEYRGLTRNTEVSHGIQRSHAEYRGLTLNKEVSLGIQRTHLEYRGLTWNTEVSHGIQRSQHLQADLDLQSPQKNTLSSTPDNG